ncbi:MAG TPA: tetratricopeptide repeat protein [Thermoanaerobaculia bacterium]
MPKHPDLHELVAFGQGRLPRRESRKVVRHLLTGCPVCEEITSRLLPDCDEGCRISRNFDYSAAFESAVRAVKVRQIAYASEQSEAPELLCELAVQPFQRQWTMIAEGPRFRTWAFCELLLDACREWGFQEPSRALEVARLGVEVAERLDPEAYGEARVNDLRARAWASQANAERILTDFRAAEKSFVKAERLLRLGTGDPLELAGLLLLKSSLLGHRQRFPEAFRMLDRVVRIGRRCGDLHLCGKALVSKGFFATMANDPEASLQYLAEGVPLVDAAAEPRLLVAARHNLIVGLTSTGRHREALKLLEQTRPLYERLGDRMNLIRLSWLEGTIARALGDFERAEALLLEVRAQLVERELGYDAALLSLDLAQIYARQGRCAEMRRLAEEMLPIFRSREIHREAASALIVFQKAASLERVTLGLVQELADYLKESRKNPGLRFNTSD